MKRTGIVIFCSLLALGMLTAFSQGTGKKNKVNNTRFIGKWRGAEVCSDVSAPVALLFIEPNNNDLKLSGIYSVQGYVNATVSGDTIVIHPQAADDANFFNLQMHGRLVFGTNPFSISGTIYVNNNGKADTCFVKYFK